MALFLRTWIAATLATALIGAAGCDARAPALGPGVSRTIPSGSPRPVASLPPGMPATYRPDVAAGEVPLQRLVPPGATVTGSWYPATPAGGDILVAYADPSADPFRAERGLAQWHRFPEESGWRPVLVIDHPADQGVLSIQTSTQADVTGDGVPDALVFEARGGSGDCGTWRVIDVANARQVFTQALCDGQITASASPVGLVVTHAVYKPGDSHCCPSAMRTRVLTYGGDVLWMVRSSTTTPTG